MYPIEKYQFKEFIKKNEDGSQSKIIAAISTYGGKIVKGISKCCDTDSYSFEKGKKLAAARCDLKVCLKRKNRADMKLAEAREALTKAEAHYNAMEHYYFDSIEQWLESSARLNKIETSFK